MKDRCADSPESQWPCPGQGKGEGRGGGRGEEGDGEKKGVGRGGSDSQLLKSFTELREAGRGGQSHTGCWYSRVLSVALPGWRCAMGCWEEHGGSGSKSVQGQVDLAGTYG